jgi:hypothetical protein
VTINFTTVTYTNQITKKGQKKKGKMTDKDRNSTAALKKFMALAPAICALVSALAQTGL